MSIYYIDPKGNKFQGKRIKKFSTVIFILHRRMSDLNHCKCRATTFWEAESSS